MLPLFEMLANAQNGNGMEALSRQFGLSQQQTQSAIEALMPAFSQGLKRNASDPYGLGSFLQAMASGQHAKYFEDASRAFSPQGVDEGNGILGHLFGSKELSRAVAGQAAQATGIGQEVLKQMLPVIASMIMGGLFKQSTGQMQAASGMGGSNNPLGEIIEQMMRQGGGMMGGGQQPRQAPQQTQAPDPFDNPFGKVLKDMFGGGLGQPQPSPRQQAPQQSPYGDNPLGKIFEEMLGGGRAQPDPQPQARQPQPQANPSGRPRNPYDDLFGKMFETGSQQRDDYQKGVESIFEQFSKGMDRYR
ncbi:MULTISPECIES: DUF937 domain-containing protein [Aminobacter]|jgi:hypothetical protein|uniref:DUF937 domain-containing protein n=2 Tax=Aminobacter TaxID=31988 RepID=A0AAC9ATE4_AMIAI|nr:MULTISPECIES: DUF937 domain-containing protein [Aminobacter]AMS44071.1 hypothetical protein AA2016_5164 [Aminobacter aminovorans]MBA8907816.1 hypothetical protein [Aminobacter ciceronei]MBA9021588.1 hypothetical protein [Aminobacter ciceronei]MBB3705538.1 hypothetical protein [Aminobacter aminovorans]MRX33918.1 DUF937 domain-containing protein [Aminobacter sp. MDW-2]